MRVLVLGAGGMAGHMITLRLMEKGHNVTGFARRKLSFCDCITGDVKDTKELGDMLQTGAYDTVINAVGILQAGMENDPANGIWTNACLPHLLAKATDGLSTRIIHLSTDCVFSGHDRGKYTERDFCSADDGYGRSKTLGELNDNKNLTFRTSIIGPDINPKGTGLFNWFMAQNGEIKGYSKAIWTGVTTLALADAIDAAMKQNLTGLYHLVNGLNINKYDLLMLFHTLRKVPISILPCEDYVIDKSLVNTRGDFRFALKTYEAMIDDMGDWILAHRQLYPHYKEAHNGF